MAGRTETEYNIYCDESCHLALKVTVMENKLCTVYIDESGDLGVGRGTDYFVISAVIVDTDEEKNIRDTIKAIRTKLNLNRIHMRDLRHFFKQAYVVRELDKHDFTFIIVIIDTNQLNMTNYTLTYNFACRILLERCSWFMRDTHRKGNVVLSARGTSRDNDLIQYIYSQLLGSNDKNVQIAHVFEKIEAKTASTWDLLDLADVCATSSFFAYQRNTLGFTAPCFLKLLEKHLYRYNGKLYSYGIKFFDQQMDKKSDLLEFAACEKK